jgi:DNA polymerase-3 subunit gamma/tau
MDVIEIDAASKTGVDDIREIIDASQYKPSSAKYKIYIIDEVHMLSKNAFNALLKTLEEPPQHMKLIFATTEVNKVPSTVLSRCMHFILEKIKKEDIVKLISSILEKEKIFFDYESLKYIAIESKGSARDSLSLLEKIRITIKKKNNLHSNTK